MRAHSHVTLEEVTAAIDVAAGRRPASLRLRRARVVNVFTNEVTRAEVLLAGRLVAAVLQEVPEGYPAPRQEVDLLGDYLRPGYIDGHVHLESSLVTPAEYARCLLPRGVTGVVCDPHELANVAGEEGVRWLLEESADQPFDVWVTAPSCVPSSPFETIGGAFGLREMERLMSDPRVVGVAELMSFPDVVSGSTEVLAKAHLGEERGLTVEGHAPSLRGAALQAYLASGVASDHESTTLHEGREKLRAGAFLMVREGSVTRDLDALLPLVDPRHGDRVGFVTDDRLPHDLLEEGGVDLLVRRAVEAGSDAAYAVRCASYNVARHYRLPRRGAVAAGYVADLAAGPDLASLPSLVIKAGTVVVQDGRLVDGALERPRPGAAQASGTGRLTVRLPGLGEDSFKLADPGGAVRVIRAIPHQILTRGETALPTGEGGYVAADVGRDLLKLACVERHGAGGGVGLGLVSGFGLKEGALASSVGHDHHNVMCVGVDDADMLGACLRLQELGGGFVAFRRGGVVAELPLPIFGLLTDLPLEAARDRLDELDAAARALGCALPSPYMALSFLGLAVIPELRLTDRGLVDVGMGRLVPFAAPA